MFVLFFFKQKTAYEMRISDWSSDVCSSDLHGLVQECRRRSGRPESNPLLPDFLGLQLSPRLRSGSAGDARETAAQHRVRQPRLHRAGLFLRRTTERARTGNASSQQGERSMTMRHVTIFGASSRQGQEQVGAARSDEHTSELQSLMRISY